MSRHSWNPPDTSYLPQRSNEIGNQARIPPWAYAPTTSQREPYIPPSTTERDSGSRVSSYLPWMPSPADAGPSQQPQTARNSTGYVPKSPDFSIIDQPAPFWNNHRQNEVWVPPAAVDTAGIYGDPSQSESRGGRELQDVRVEYPQPRNQELGFLDDAPASNRDSPSAPHLQAEGQRLSTFAATDNRLRKAITRKPVPLRPMQRPAPSPSTRPSSATRLQAANNASTIYSPGSHLNEWQPPAPSPQHSLFGPHPQGLLRPGRFMMITPGMRAWAIDRPASQAHADVAIDPMTPLWLEYRAQVQNLCRAFRRDTACGIAACSGNIISTGDFGIEMAGSTYQEHHAEEALLSGSRRTRRRLTSEWIDGRQTDVWLVELDVQCVLLGIEPCFGGRYPGHKCRDFFSSAGRLFRPRVGSVTAATTGVLRKGEVAEAMWVRARFVPRSDRGVTPVFCYEMQRDKANPVPSVLSALKKTTGQGPNFAWLDAKDDLWGSMYGDVMWISGDGRDNVWRAKREAMQRFLEQNGWEARDGFVVLRGSTAPGMFGRSNYDVRTADGSERPFWLKLPPAQAQGPNMLRKKRPASSR
ncbi:uncharacterized protein VDAG_04534 [Verticillium dahliae VdLs.17]|uniref:Uncharacterized protein n=1 Tax=Verticillium dahliae (strain VdLs.17 / ATCC MYA-4575 / FGSC 10137) TaxID=498257 RepID=G2X2L0_VERDV|nr:uncharacterized protein VDAG_04534 [Verticillium dahliae VdLs.17]EGY23096.1 hypothetical protein VDAG_04534 [Verticillium dahliae VdLs.17]